MNWEVEVIRNKEDLIRDTQKFLQINSVMDESTAIPAGRLEKASMPA